MSPLRRAGRIALIVALVAASYGAGVLTGVVGTRTSEEQTVASKGVLDEAADKIMADAASPVSRDQLDRAAVEGMLKALGDRWSAYYQPTEFDSFQAGLDGRYTGIGVWLRAAQDGQVYVGSVQPGTPAEGAGILAGDRLVSIAGEPVGEKLSDVAGQLRGDAGTRVTVVVERDGEESTIAVTRADVASDDVTVSRLKSGVQVVRVSEFTRGVGAAVRKAVSPAALSQQAPEGVVLDLRGNPGGLLTEAVEVASAFLEGGTVVSYEKRGEPVRHLDAVGDGNTAVPLVVLVDEGTASAAEVVAAALQDRNRAVIVGGRTYGKGSVQEPRQLSDGSAIELTVGRYLTPSGRSLDGVGIEPDVVVSPRLGAATAEQRALEVLLGLVAASDLAERG
ncbi:MAG: S41 family peptidase [Actinobacteria bacterium]|nr:S41 family peptidase [Actinomycetota bacterium]